MNIDYKNMSEEDITYFQEKYIDMFERIKACNLKMKKEIEETLGDVPRINTVNMTGFGKLLFAAKKVLLNTGITFATGIEPRFLPNGADKFFSSDGRRARYQNSNQLMLAYSTCEEVEVGIDKTLELLNEKDPDKLRKTISKFGDLYREMIKSNYQIDEVAECFSPQIIYFMVKFLKTLKEMTYDKIDVLVANGLHIGLYVNLPKEIKEIIENRENTKIR